jgi:hypothetical protein
MSATRSKLNLSLLMLLAFSVSAIPTLGAPAVIGSVAGGTNATVGGQTLQANSMLFSGDTLRVSNGAAEVAMDMGSLVVFGRDTVASFDRVPNEVIVLLGQGNVSMFHPQDAVGLRVRVGTVSVFAGQGFKTAGEVAMVNGAVVVTAKEGMLRVEGPERSMELTKGKTIAIMPKSAGSPQPPQASAGTPVSHFSVGEWVGIASLGAAGTSATLGVVNIKKTNDAKKAADAANASAQKADADAIAATAAANAATAAATAARAAANAALAAAEVACQAVSATNPACNVPPQ